MALVIAPFPLSLMFAGRTGTGESYLTWQLFRRPNHDWLFYPTTVPEAIGPLVLLAAGIGLWLLRREASWRERLLLCWIAVPVAFFQLWPVKGFQYLLPIAPAIAVLAARAHHSADATAGVAGRGDRRGRACSSPRGTGSRARPAAPRSPAPEASRPGARPGGGSTRTSRTGRRFMTIGPSMANLVQYYGHRKAYGLSVSPNPLNRNPSYEPLDQPRPGVPRQRDPVRRLGHLLGQPLAQVLAQAAPLRGPLQRPGRAQELLQAPTDRRTARDAGDRRVRGAAVRFAAALALCVAIAATCAPAAAAGEAQTPIEHFVVLMQENHSFDNYFGTFPGRERHTRKHLHAGRPRRARRLRAAVPPRRPAVPDLATTAAPTTPVRRRRDGRLRPSGLDRPPEGRALRDGLLRRARPALLLERRAGLRPVRPLLRRLGRRQRAPTTCSGSREGPGRRGPRSSTGSRRAGSRGSSTSQDYDPRRSLAANGAPTPAPRPSACRC